jgi:outer membrane protein assembly factor BamB
VVASDRQFNIGAILSSPLVMNGIVYFGSTDGNLYAIE